MAPKSVRVDDAFDRLAVVSDLHATAECLPALDAAFAELPGRTRVIVNGDLFNWGVSPVETVEWARQRAEGCAVHGNHDEWIFTEHLDGGFSPDVDRAALRLLNAEQARFLRGLPAALEVAWRGRTVRLMHGHRTLDGGPGDFTWPPDRLISHFGDPAVDLTVTSHTHFACVKRTDDVLYANSGSAAYPFVAVRMEDGSLGYPGGEPIDPATADKRATFLSITDPANQLDVEIIRFNYDREAALERLRHVQGMYPHEHHVSLLRDGVLDLTVTKHV